MGKCQPWSDFETKDTGILAGSVFSIAQGEVPYNRRSSISINLELRNEIQSASRRLWKFLNIPYIRNLYNLRILYFDYLHQHL